MRLLLTILVFALSLTLQAQVKIPLTRNYIYQDNSQQDRADILVDGLTTTNYTPSGPKIYPNHEVTFYLYDWNATVARVEVKVSGGATCNYSVYVVRKSDYVETLIGTYTGGSNQQFTNSVSGAIAKVILRANGTNYNFGSEVEIYGTYTTPAAVLPGYTKPRKPIGELTGANGHEWDGMNNAKLEAIKKMGFRRGSLRIWEYADQIVNTSNQWNFEGAANGGRYFTDSFFRLLKIWSPQIFTWKVIAHQYADQKASWDVIDDFPNKYIRGTVVNYNDYGGWGQVTINVTAVAGATEGSVAAWYIYKNGSLANVTLQDESFSASLVGQNRVYNTGGGLGFAPGDVLTFYKSQRSVNPIFFANRLLPDRNSYDAHLRTAQGASILASRGGSRTDGPTYTTQMGQPMKRGFGYYNAVEQTNEPNAWWRNLEEFWNGKTIGRAMSMYYDGHKGLFSTGIKRVDSTLKVPVSGLATDKPDQVMAMIDDWRRERGLKWNGRIDAPTDAINYHTYLSAEGQYGGGTSGGLPPEMSMMQKLKDMLWVMENYLPGIEWWITEWGYDHNSGSALRAGQFGSYARERVGAIWMVRYYLMLGMFGVDRAPYYQLAQPWPESGSNGNPTIFATMRLMSQPVDADENNIVLAPGGEYMAQLNDLLSDYVYYDSVTTSSPWLHCYRFKHESKDSLIVATWSEEVTQIVSNSPVFTERTGTLNVPIREGAYNLRTLRDDGVLTMTSSSGTSTGTVPVSYSSKPVFIQTSLSELPPAPGAKRYIDRITLRNYRVRQ